MEIKRGKQIKQMFNEYLEVNYNLLNQRAKLTQEMIVVELLTMIEVQLDRLANKAKVLLLKKEVLVTPPISQWNFKFKLSERNNLN